MTTSKLPRPVAVVVLAAGKGTRLPGTVAKALVECLGEPLLAHVRRAIAPLHPKESVVVVGHAREAVSVWLEGHWPEAHAAVQEPQNGTGHAARVALAAIPDFRGDVVVVCADVPQLTTDDLTELLAAHRRSGACATVLVGEASDPGRLGRVERGTDGRIVRIVEARDATPEQLAIREFNTGIYVFDAARLGPALDVLPRENAQGEQYLTDAIESLAAAGYGVEAVRTANGASLLGVNTPGDLAAAVADLRRRIVGAHLAAGVQIVDPASTVIEDGVRIAPGARILPFTYIGHGCSVGAGCVVGPVRAPAGRDRARGRRPDRQLRRGEGDAHGQGGEGEAPDLPRRRRRRRGREHRLRHDHGELRREEEAQDDGGARAPTSAPAPSSSRP